MKKGRHRRFEEARALKISTTDELPGARTEPCPECSADPDDDHASWCMFEAVDDDDVDDVADGDAGAAGAVGIDRDGA